MVIVLFSWLFCFVCLILVCLWILVSIELCWFGGWCLDCVFAWYMCLLIYLWLFFGLPVCLFVVVLFNCCLLLVWMCSSVLFVELVTGLGVWLFGWVFLGMVMLIWFGFVVILDLWFRRLICLFECLFALSGFALTWLFLFDCLVWFCVVLVLVNLFTEVLDLAFVCFGFVGLFACLDCGYFCYYGS